MNIESTKLNKNQLLAAQMLATGQSGRDVAKALNIAPETISRWRQQAEFKNYLDRFLSEASEATRQRLETLMKRAINLIEESIDEPSLSPKDRFSMGVKILELCKVEKQQNDEKSQQIIDYEIEKGKELLQRLIEKHRMEYNV
jgi:transposase-like protein